MASLGSSSGSGNGGGPAAASSSSSSLHDQAISRSSLQADSRQVSPNKKASPSDVIFGQPPGNDARSQLYEQLTSDSILLQSSSGSDESQLSDTAQSRAIVNQNVASDDKEHRKGQPSPFDAVQNTTSIGSASSGSSGGSVYDRRHGGGDAPMDVDRMAIASSSMHATPSTTATSDVQQVPNDVHLHDEDEDENAKVLPALFEECDAEDVVILVADMLTRLTAHNDLLPLHPSSLTRFHSRATPSITILSYLKRISKYTSLEKSCTLILLVYIDRVCQRNAGFTICSLTVHRFVCAAVVCASKALCDAFSTNGHYARVGGISLVELNMLEKEFLNIIDWKLSCSGALLQHYYTSLVRSHGDYALDKQQQPETVTAS